MLATVQAEVGARLGQPHFLLWRCPARERRLAFDAGFTPLYWPGDVSTLSSRLMRKMHLDLPVWSARETAPASIRHIVNGVGNRDRWLGAAYDHFLERSNCALDAVLDVSGFAYGDAWSPGRIAWNSPIFEHALRRAIPIIYLPQAWGSFVRPEIAKATRSLLSVPGTLCFSRDAQSTQYLEQLLGVPQLAIRESADIAFAFRGGTAEQGTHLLRRMGCDLSRPVIGIAPNMQIYRRAHGVGGQNRYVRSLVTLARHCIQDLDVNVVLLAFEIDAAGSGIDDRYLCALISAAIATPERCFRTNDALTATETCAVMSRLELLVGSRFHSLVLSLSQGIPALAIGWSHKYQGLLSAFAAERYVHDFRSSSTDEILKSLDNAWDEREQLRSNVQATSNHLRTQVHALFDEIAARIASGNESSHAE